MLLCCIVATLFACGSQAATVNGTADDTAGVYLFSAGEDGSCLNPGDAAAQPTDDIVSTAVGFNLLDFIGDTPEEVVTFSSGPPEGGESTRDNSLSEVNEGLAEVDDFGVIANGNDDDANYDAGSGGDAVVHLTNSLVIKADGVLATGTIGPENEGNANDADVALGGFEIFIFEDAELSGMVITLFTPLNQFTITIDDHQVDPIVENGADDTLIGIDLDSLPGWDGTHVNQIKLEDDAIAMGPNACGNTFGDTSLELDAVAVRKAALSFAFELQKFVSDSDTGPWDDADTPMGPLFMQGQDVFFRFELRNDSEVTLTNLTLVDDTFDLPSLFGTTADCPPLPDTLAMGDAYTCVVGPFPAVLGPHTNVATATAEFDAQLFEDMDPAHYFSVIECPSLETFQAACEQQTECVNPAVTCDGLFGIELISTQRQGSQVTFTYEVCGVGSGPDLSNWAIGLGQIDCLAEGKTLSDLIVDCTPSPCALEDPDPNLGITGLKFDELAIGENECATFSFTLDEAALEPCVQLAADCGVIAGTKAGLSVAYACVLGPVCVPLECDPQLECPPDITVECDASTDPSSTGRATASEECPGIQISFSDTSQAGNCPQENIITRTWTSIDECGNSASCEQTITVVDTTPPVISCPADVTVECDADSSPTHTGTATASDNCDGSPTVTFSDAESAGACPQEKTITRTWTATDDCGNSASCEQTITVVDTTPPVISCPADVTVECDADSSPTHTGTATASDNCDASPTVTFSDAESAGACPQEKTITRTWTATDDCGNSASCEQTITVVDTTPPVISCPADVTVECDADSSPAATGTATATDNCDSEPTVTFSDSVEPGACASGGGITRTWTATDACGNTSSCIQTITIDDTTPPQISCPADVTVECDASTDPSTTGEATCTDNCDAEVTPTFSDSVAPGSCPQESVITRTWTCTDDCGNSSSCEQTITVVDTTPPTLNCPADVTIECDVSTSPETAGEASATDNCDSAVSVTFTDSMEATTCARGGSITRTWTAKDACGNTSSCVQIITIDDTTPPQISCPADVTVECDASTDPSTTGEATCTDNCDAEVTPTFSDSVAPGSCPQERVITRTWTCTDDCGNSASCEQTITVVDTTPPELSCPELIELSGDGNCEVQLPEVDVTTSDNCAGTVTVTQDPEAGTTVMGPGDSTITVTASDECGNSTSCEVTLRITCEPSIDLDKTVACGQDGGASCPGEELIQGAVGTPITYCFELTNDGATYLDEVTITDPALGITELDMTLVSGSFPLAPGTNAVLIFETTIVSNLVNEATVEANPTTSDGTDISGLEPVSDVDSAEVQEVNPQIVIFKTPSIQQIPSGTDAHFMITVSNSGDVALFNVTVSDPLSPDCDQNIGELGPGEFVSYVCTQTNVLEDFCNIATACGDPPCGETVCDQDEADVIVFGEQTRGGQSLATISKGCTRTVDYWYEHPSVWPITRLALGGVVYNQSQLFDILDTAPAGDVTYAVAEELLASLLNAFNEADASLMLSHINDAQDWLARHPLGSSPTGTDREHGLFLAETLADYNTGLLGPESCVDTVSHDFDADGVSDPGQYDPPLGKWTLVMSQAGSVTDTFGFSKTLPVAHDYDGDGADDIAVYYPPMGDWFIMASSAGFRTTKFGYAGTQPVVDDWDRDGLADYVLYDDRVGTWFLMKSTEGFESRQFGYAGTLPVPGDYDRDGTLDIGVYDPNIGTWFLMRSTKGFSTEQFGFAGTVPVAADYDGDGKTDLAVYDSAQGMWYIMASTEGFSTRQFGYAGTVPVLGDYDGDGRTDISVCDPAAGTLYLFKSTEGFERLPFDPGAAIPLGMRP